MPRVQGSSGQDDRTKYQKPISLLFYLLLYTLLIFVYTFTIIILSLKKKEYIYIDIYIFIGGQDG